jgi:hypothetical protein
VSHRWAALGVRHFTARRACRPGSLTKRKQEWILYVFDLIELPVGWRTAPTADGVHPTEVGVIQEMARCLLDRLRGRHPDD